MLIFEKNLNFWHFWLNKFLLLNCKLCDIWTKLWLFLNIKSRNLQKIEKVATFGLNKFHPFVATSGRLESFCCNCNESWTRKIAEDSWRECPRGRSLSATWRPPADAPEQNLLKSPTSLRALTFNLFSSIQTPGRSGGAVESDQDQKSDDGHTDAGGREGGFLQHRDQESVSSSRNHRVLTPNTLTADLLP